MSVEFAELFATGLFFTCLWHAWRFEGRAFAQQWFFTAYVFAIVRENLFALFQNVEYAEGVIRFGSAPVALVLNFASFTYIAYWMAHSITRACGESDISFGPLGWRFIALVSALILPLEFAATRFRWWTYPLDAPYSLVGNLPYFVPLAWSASAAFFYFIIWRVRRIPFRGNGQFFALVTASPVMGVLGFVVYVLVEFISALIASGGLAAALTTLLAALWFGIPLAQMLGKRKPNT